MKSIYWHMVLGAALGLLLPACSSDNGGSSCDPVDLGLEGTWQSSSCEMADTLNYRNTTIVLGESDITISHQYYTDDQCATEDNTIMESPVTGVYSIGCPITTQSGVPAYELDLVADANGQTYLDIIYVNSAGTEMQVSGNANTSTRPQTLDTDKTFYLQP